MPLNTASPPREFSISQRHFMCTLLFEYSYFLRVRMVRKIPFDSEILIFDFNVLSWFSLKKEAARGNFVKSKQKKNNFPHHDSIRCTLSIYEKMVHFRSDAGANEGRQLAFWVHHQSTLILRYPVGILCVTNCLCKKNE